MSDPSRRKLRVLAVSHLASRGGAQKCLAMLCRSLDRDRFEIQAVLPEEGELAGDLRVAGAKVHVLPLRWWVGVEARQNWMKMQFRVGLARRVRRLAALLESERIDLVMTNSSVTIEGALAAAQARIPHVYHILELMSTDPILRPMCPVERFYWIMDRLSAALVVPSRSVRDEVTHHCRDARTAIIHTGIDRLEREELRRTRQDLFGFSDAESIVCFVGELWARKGVQALVRAAPLVLEHNPNVRFLVVGHDRGELGPATRLAGELGVETQVRFLGERSDALEIIASSDLLVLPSLSDPFPVVVLEAMALGLPAVVTRSGGAAEMQVNGETGIVVQPDSPAEMARALSRLLADRDLSVSMGLSARERARSEYSLARYASSFAELFIRIVERGSAESKESAALVSDLLHAADARLERTQILSLASEVIRAIRRRIRSGAGG